MLSFWELYAIHSSAASLLYITPTIQTMLLFKFYAIREIYSQKDSEKCSPGQLNVSVGVTAGNLNF